MQQILSQKKILHHQCFANYKCLPITNTAKTQYTKRKDNNSQKYKHNCTENINQGTTDKDKKSSNPIFPNISF